MTTSLFERAKAFIPGGVSSPVRAFHGVGGDPLFIKKGYGAYIVDQHDKAYIDYIGSWGPMILGHAHPQVIEKVSEALACGFSFGTPTEIEVKLAQKITEIMPAIEMIRFVNSGTEATMSAIRLARGYTGRNKIIKFIGCYHGHVDYLLVAAGSGAMTLGVPNSAGVPDSFTQHTLLADFNDLDQVARLFEHYGDDIAGIIVEPVAGNMNLVTPRPDFLTGLRELCDRYQSLLIFDEVMTGFRVHLGGAQAHYGVKPDITALGKIIGGGFPVGAFGGRADIMRSLAPLGPVYQAGTLSGNPVAMAAGLATLTLICEPHFHEKLSAATLRLMQGLKHAADQFGIPLYVNAVGGMFGFFFTDQTNLYAEADVKRCNVALFKRFFHGMLQEGVYLAPSAFEAGFVSSAHTPEIIEQTIQAAHQVFNELSLG